MDDDSLSARWAKVKEILGPEALRKFLWVLVAFVCLLIFAFIVHPLFGVFMLGYLAGTFASVWALMDVVSELGKDR